MFIPLRQIPAIQKANGKMTDRANNSQRIEYRIVLIETHSMKILAIAGATGPHLLRESIPVYTRVAAALTEAINQRYGLCTVQLASLPGDEVFSYCAVLEIIGTQQAMSGGLLSVALDEIASSELTDEERATVLRIMKGEASELGRFAQPGSIEKLLAKVLSHQDPSDWPIIRQLNQGTDFCLLSLSDASGRRVWFKAVGEPNTREYALTAELARRFPAYLPKILATIPEWNGWLMEDVNGIPLNESTSMDQCERALTALAAMQRELAIDVDVLSTLGAKNWTCAQIRSHFEPFFQEALCAMEAQVSTKSKPLSGRELLQLRNQLESALDEFMNAGIPETLIHGDIGHGNILATRGGPVFLDWAETYIGHPFLCTEHLLADLARSNPIFARNQAALRSHYAALWNGYVRPTELKKIIALAPTFGAFVYGLIAWDASRNRPDPAQAWPLIRSLLRRTRRELEHAVEVSA